MKPKYNIYDRVCYKDENKWIVGNISGIQAKIGYDMMLWEYTITNNLYGDSEPKNWGARTDITTSKWLREDQVFTVDYMIDSRKKELDNQKLLLEKEIEKLNNETLIYKNTSNIR